MSIGKALGKLLEEKAAKVGKQLLVPNPGDAQARAYAALSRGAHPRPSLRPERVVLQSGRFEITIEQRDLEGDRKALDALLAGALNFGTSAINVRLAMDAA